MSQKMIRASYYGDKLGEFEIDEYPDACPICHQGIEPGFRCAWYEDRVIVATLLCPKKRCKSLFVSFFVRDPEATTGPSIPIHRLQGSFPWKRKEHVFPDEIKTISPMFITIYNESEEAEQRGLKNICGPGYRKALEFLIKDYLVQERKLPADVIRMAFLGPCIEKHITDGNIKDCAKRAAWLGNDQTHYDKKWGDKDLADLKNLIELTVTWIHSEYVTKKIKEEMPEGKLKGGT